MSPWTFAAYRLWRDGTLYQISAQSNNLQRSYAIWPYDLEHVLSVALGSGIILIKFDLRQLIHAWVIAFFDADTLCQAVTLTFDPLTLKVCGTLGVKVFKVCTKFEWNRSIPGWIIDNFANFCTRYVTPWPWPLTSWSWTFTTLRVSCV